MATTLSAQDRNANALRRMRSKDAKNAKKEAELQRREKAAGRQRREEGVPVHVDAVSTAGHHASVTSAATSGAPAFGPMSG